MRYELHAVWRVRVAVKVECKHHGQCPILDQTRRLITKATSLTALDEAGLGFIAA
jgi:hypothetical protein